MALFLLDGGVRTNSDRAAMADEALDTFTSICFASEDVEDKQTRIKDLITNLLHLARLECDVEDMSHFAGLAAQMAEMEAQEDPDYPDDEEDDDEESSNG